MNFGELMGLFIWMSGMVATFAVLGNSYRHRLAHKLRIAELRAMPAPSVFADHQADLVERLEHRIRVLERIVTDKGVDVANQIEALRDTRKAEPLSDFSKLGIS